MADTTTAKPAEATLRARLIRAEEVAQMGFLDWNLASDVVECSKGACRLFGIDPDTPLTAEQLTNLVHPDDRALVESNLDLAIRRIRDYDMDHRMVRPDGRVIWVHARGDIERCEDGAPTSVLGTVVDITERKIIEEKLLLDITERKQAEAKLRDSEARFRMIYEHAPVMIDAFDADGRCIMFNKECEKVFGWSAEEIYAHDDPLTLFYPDPEIQRQVVETVTSKPEKVFREWHPRRKDGSKAVCLWANFKLPDGLVINLGYDITERTKSEEDMRLLRSELLHTTRVLTMGEFTGALAHELNHPLGSILNNANAAKRVLEHEEPDLAELRNIVADIISEDRRASEVITRLRDLLKKTEVELAPVRINDVIEEVIGLIHSDFVIKNISLSKQLANELPEVRGDRVQLQQVFLNLILNATDAMKASKEKNLQISTSQNGGNAIMICVKDSGGGFDQKEKENLFAPFFSTKKEGLGMGLPIAQTIVRALHGDIWIETNEKGGASFFVTLPVPEKNQA